MFVISFVVHARGHFLKQRQTMVSVIKKNKTRQSDLLVDDKNLHPPEC